MSRLASSRNVLKRKRAQNMLENVADTGLEPIGMFLAHIEHF